MDPPDQAPPPVPASTGVESTAVLLTRVRNGESQARERLFARYLPMLQRWARGRLPHHARGFLDTSDLVQTTLLRSLDKLETFDPRHQGAFLGYLRRILLNLIRDEVRRVRREPAREEIDEALVGPGPSPLEEAIGGDLLEQYEAAMSRLPPEQQEALLMSIEFGCTNDEIAEATGRPTANAARVYVIRAMVRLAEEMGRIGKGAR
jgi:RNA polymerase sigma-70 factor (ECF subfamily)